MIILGCFGGTTISGNTHLDAQHVFLDDGCFFSGGLIGDVFENW